ncbi:MAG: alkaline phosphatase D family protein [Pontibacterium sp.]
MNLNDLLDQSPVIAGPILRRCTVTEVNLWLVCGLNLRPELCFSQNGEPLVCNVKTESFPFGSKVQAVLLTAQFDNPLPENQWIEYDLCFEGGEGMSQPLSMLEPQLCYSEQSTLGFIIKSHLDHVLHGSCRKPHLAPSKCGVDKGDGLVCGDEQLATWINQGKEDVSQWPSVCVMSGDQVYVDDVSGPMLHAIHQVIAHLELPCETLQGTQLKDSTELTCTTPYYYRRDEVLPQGALHAESEYTDEQIETLETQFFEGAKKPIFTSAHAKNHLMTLSEMIAMYCLVWSPRLWKLVDAPCPNVLKDTEFGEVYLEEAKALQGFTSGLAKVRRFLAHVPSAMIFDDHDVTDDWNLTAMWEQAAYNHPLSKRVIGNALLAYLVCQGIGNNREAFSTEMLNRVRESLSTPGTKQHDDTVDELLRFSCWHYQWDTTPLLIVLDTRTHRWRSERGLNQPSGLMDWEAITDLQQTLLDHKSVILVSPAPVFGVKLIEVIQRIVTWMGKPLLVDAENWMAHKGAALALLSLFKHPRTPKNFTILSGDVHYSFAYDIELKGKPLGKKADNPRIWQITSSGMRNEFPKRLLDVFDRLNRVLYSPRSPLNWFTKRRRMKITPRVPDKAERGERLFNASGIGRVRFDEQGRPILIEQLIGTGGSVRFDPDEKAASWE